MILNTTHAIGWKAKDFALQGVDGKTYSLADVRGPKGTLVVFICNHCPYVKASINRIVAEAKALREIDIGTIAKMPNDTEAYLSENSLATRPRNGRRWSSSRASSRSDAAGREGQMPTQASA
jgi:hypothetical protein